MRPALYKDLLTPALHRRFTGAAGIILLICYVESVLIGDKSSCELKHWHGAAKHSSDLYSVFWSWFPIGTAGIRTLLLFISALSVFVLRVAQLHIGTIDEERLRDIFLISDRGSNYFLAGRDIR